MLLFLCSEGLLLECILYVHKSTLCVVLLAKSFYFLIMSFMILKVLPWFTFFVYSIGLKMELKMWFKKCLCYGFYPLCFVMKSFNLIFCAAECGPKGLFYIALLDFPHIDLCYSPWLHWLTTLYLYKLLKIVEEHQIKWQNCTTEKLIIIFINDFFSLKWSWE